ncbi:MAG: transketolase [Eubacteriales bacterium]|nr:transketolase [Eubacteriales bacterium]
MKSIEQKAITNIRFLAAEAVQKAKSGHPGLPIGSAPMAFTLWKQMKHDPKDPSWTGRDRFVLSAGHASMLEYSLLHLFGYDLPMEELMRFRQWGSKTPGHPEFGHTAGVETTTGPLGQGIATAVGMAMAETRLAAEFNRDGFPVVDNYTYALSGDGCLMEGVASEAASLAGHLGLGKLILLYDRNEITIEGSTHLAFTEDVGKRFEAYGWTVQHVASGEDTEAIAKAIQAAKADQEHPSLIIVRTEIAHGTPKANSASAHGEPLGEDAIKAMREFYGWNEAPFTVPEDVKAYFAELQVGYSKQHAAYDAMMEQYRKAYPDLYKKWIAWHEKKLPEELKKDERLWSMSGDKATRAVSGEVLNIFAEYLPNLFGGSADLAPSNKTELKGKGFYGVENRLGANIHFGIREFAMAAICNGIQLYGGFHAFCATFLVFADYLKPALRLSAIMHQPVVFVLTHDSIGVGEDGPTHEPIEQLASLRATPDTLVFRPADAKETAASYIMAFEAKKPSVLALTRQNLPQYAETGEGAYQGGYILRDAKGGKPDVILMASGSEVELIYKAADLLEAEGISSRLVSMPCLDLFDDQTAAYKESVLPNKVRARVAVEAGSAYSWDRYVGLDGETVCIDHYGASAPASILFKEFGFTPENVAKAAKASIAKTK